MKVLEVIAENIAATTLMTAFSMLLSASFRKLFTEPILINYMFRLFRLGPNPKLSGILGWCLHYWIGLAFVAAYHLIWQYRILEPDWMAGLLLGAVSGIIGILGWMFIFWLPRDKPNVAFTAYYIQLFFAHVIFALAAVATHKLLMPRIFNLI